MRTNTSIIIRVYFTLIYFLGITTINFQLHKHIRFDEGTMKLLTLSSILDQNDAYKSFNIDDIHATLKGGFMQPTILTTNTQQNKPTHSNL
jgi:hypothetical protein